MIHLHPIRFYNDAALEVKGLHATRWETYPKNWSQIDYQCWRNRQSINLRSSLL